MCYNASIVKRGKVLKLSVAFLVLALVIIGAVILSRDEPAPAYQAPEVTQTSKPEIKEDPVKEMVEAINTERSKVGVPPLSIDDRLNNSASLKAQDMEKNGYFGHVNPKTGKNGYEYIQEENIANCRASENLSRDSSVEKSMEWLMNSPAHKAAILNPNATAVGVGYKKTFLNTLYVQHFCFSR